MTLGRHTRRRSKRRIPSRLPSGQSPARNIDDALDRAGAQGSAFPLAAPVQHVPAAVPEGAYPYEDIPVSEALEMPGDDMIDRVVRRRLAEPSPLDAAVPVALTAEPVMGDRLPAPAAGAPARACRWWEDPEPAPPLDPFGAVLLGAPAWMHIVEAARIHSGEWDDLAAEFDRAHSHNAADEEAGMRHSRRTIGEGWREICILRDCTDQLVPGWRKIRHLSRLTAGEIVAGADDPATLQAVAAHLIAAAQAAPQRGPSFIPNMTAPQPVLRESGRAA